MIIIRVSEHGTSLNTWIRRRTDPSQSLQNLSVIFSNEPVSSKMITEPVKYTDKEGKVALRYLYFVVEQYVYKMENLSKNDFIKFIKKLKLLNSDKVFKDPFKKKPNKREKRIIFCTKSSFFSKNFLHIASQRLSPAGVN